MCSRARKSKRVGSTIQDGPESSKRSKSGSSGRGGSSSVSTTKSIVRGWGFGN